MPFTATFLNRCGQGAGGRNDGIAGSPGFASGKGERRAGNTEKYYSQIAQDEEIYEKTRLKDQRRAKEVEQFITRFRAKARLAGMVQSRIKTLAKLEKKTKLQSMRDLEFSFHSLPFRGKHVLSARELTFAYPERPTLFTDLDFSIHAGDRICVVGPNGRGKTTLLRLLAGQLSPESGDVSYHPAVTQGFYEQTNIQTLNDFNTVEEEILTCDADVDRQHARNICGAMLFEGDAALKRISVLSGGEKARVMLGKLLVTPVNVLLLDEPSNHLDMESCDALMAAIDNFDGAVIMVTHNEMFLHALAQRLIVFDRGQVTVFEGTYQSFLDKGGWGDEDGPAPGADKPDAPAMPHTSKKELRQRRSALINERSRELKPVNRAIEKAEAEIETQEQGLAELNDEMVEASQNQDGARIAKLSPAIHERQRIIDAGFEALEALYEEKERLQKSYDRKLIVEGLDTHL